MKFSLISFSILGLLIFLTSVYPVAVYRTWDERDIDKGNRKDIYGTIEVPVGGILYIRAKGDNPHSFWWGNPDDEDEDAPYYDTSVDVRISKGSRLIWSGEVNSIIAGHKVRLPSRGQYTIEASNPEGYDINMGLRFIGRSSEVSCCCSCCVLPLIGLCLVIFILTMSSKYRKHHPERKRRDDPEGYQGSERSEQEVEDYYHERWKDP